MEPSQRSRPFGDHTHTQNIERPYIRTGSLYKASRKRHLLKREKCNAGARARSQLCCWFAGLRHAACTQPKRESLQTVEKPCAEVQSKKTVFEATPREISRKRQPRARDHPASQRDSLARNCAFGFTSPSAALRVVSQLSSRLDLVRKRPSLCEKLLFLRDASLVSNKRASILLLFCFFARSVSAS